MIKIASFGCGVDSVAMLLLSRDQGIEYDEIIFSDVQRLRIIPEKKFSSKSY